MRLRILGQGSHFPEMYERVGAHPKAVFYASLSAFAGVETQGFDMLDL